MNLSELSDENLLKEAKKMKQSKIYNALIIGFCAGVLFYSLVKNSWGMLSLIPLYFIYKLVNKSKYEFKELEQILKDRNLKY